MVSSLTQAIQGAIQEVIPMSKLVKNKLNNMSYLHHAAPDHPCHTKHKAVSDKYGNAIREAKTQHVSNLGLWNRNIAVESLLEEELVDRVPQ